MNRILLFFISVLLTYSISHDSVAQKKWIDSKPNTLQSEFDLFFSKAETAYKNGDYFRAKNLYDYCAKMAHPRLPEAIKKKDISINLWLAKTTAERHVKEGNSFEALKAYNQITSINPNDVVSTRMIATLSGRNQNTDTNTQPLTVAAVKPNPPSRIPATIRSKPLEDKAAERERERQRVRKAANELFETTYAKGIYFLRDCNYNESLECFKEAHKMRPGAAKTRKYFQDIQTIINLNQDIKEWKSSTNSSTKDILSLYERITKLNSGFELTQSNTSCTNTESVTCDYIWNELPNEATKFNCPQILSFADRLSNCPPSRENQSRLERLVSSCKTLDNDCIIANQLISNRIEEANRLQSQGFYEASNSSFNAITTEIEKLKNTCKDFNSTTFEDAILDGKKRNTEILQNKMCRDKQQVIYEKAGDLTEKNQLKEAIDLYTLIDTLCVEDGFKEKIKIETKRITTIYRQRTLADLEKVAAYWKDQRNYDLEGKLLNEALTFADLEIDKNRIQTKLAINKCYRETGKNCEDVKPAPPCKDTTTIKQTNIQLLAGINLSSLNSEYLAPVVSFQNAISTGSYNPIPFIGLRLNRQSFKKNLDFNTSLLYTPSTELSFLNDNGTTISNLKYNNFDFDFNLKFHRLRDCNDEGRAYIFAGGNAGYKQLISSTTPAQATSDFVSEYYSKVLLGGFQTGIGYEFPKDKLNFEIEFKRQAMFSNGVNNLEESNSIFNSPFSLGYVGIKLGYTLKNWTNPKQ